VSKYPLAAASDSAAFDMAMAAAAKVSATTESDSVASSSASLPESVRASKQGERLPEGEGVVSESYRPSEEWSESGVEHPGDGVRF
jgi:hypothetical protein